MHGYKPGQVQPTTELLLRHKHPEDRERVAAVLERVMKESRSAAGTASSTPPDAPTASSSPAIGWSTTPARWRARPASTSTSPTRCTDITNVLSAVADARSRIEQAKGVLMIAYGISAERAFDILVWRSQESNLKVRDVAGRFLDAVASKASAETQSHVDQALLTLE